MANALYLIYDRINLFSTAHAGDPELLVYTERGIAVNWFHGAFNMIPDFWNHFRREKLGNLILYMPFGSGSVYGMGFSAWSSWNCFSPYSAGHLT